MGEHAFLSFTSSVVSICLLMGPTIERGRHAGRRDSLELHHYYLHLIIESATYLEVPKASQRRRTTISRKMN